MGEDALVAALLTAGPPFGLAAGLMQMHKRGLLGPCQPHHPCLALAAVVALSVQPSSS